MSPRFVVLVTAALALALAATARARPGGGQTFSGSAPSYGSSPSYSGSSWSSSGSSSSGSSWSSGSSSSSSSGSWWSGWGTGSKSSSSSSDSSYGSSSSSSYGSSYEPSYSRSSDTDDVGRRGARPYVAPPDPPVSRYFLFPGILLGVVLAGAGVAQLIRKREERAWASYTASLDDELDAIRIAQQRQARARYPTVRTALAAIQSKDDAFSWILFEDFLHALYVEAHTLRGKRRLDLLRPYIRPEALARLEVLPAVEVTAIVVGGLETREISLNPQARTIHVRVGFEANYSEGSQSYAVREEWTLVRGADVPSRPPKRARVIGCANCGAPLEKLVGEACEHCGAPSAPGSRDWEVTSIAVEAREARAPQLTGTTEEQGTDLPTLVAPDVKGEYGALVARDPEFSWSDFLARVGLVFHSFHRAWSAQDLAGVRPYMSDQLFDAQRYWVDAYRAQGLRNLTENPEIVSVILSRIVHDKYFDALTVRVFAQCTDYTIDREARVVGGSRDTPRRYSEYWTLIRSVERRGAARKDPACPNCGAPIEHINMAGECQSCHVQVTTGEFDWVLSRIEQDEVYRL